jgi:two-component system, LytTR family, sensor kinase
MEFKVRYKFWKVVLGVIGLGLFFYMLYLFYREGAKSTDVTDIKPKTKSSGKGTGLSALFMFFFLTVFFYFALNLYYTQLAGYKRFIEFVKVTAVLFAGSLVYDMLLYFMAPSLLMNDYDSFGDMFSGLVSGFIPMALICFMYAYITNMREAVKQRRILQEQKLQLEAQISQANFNFLKSQINPHFLHNTLNFLYSKSLPLSDELSEGILTLSDIMRYALNQGNQKDGKAPLKDEIEHVHNVIKISQLRYNQELHVNFEVSGSADGKMIIPFVLITLVENAFKHGDLKSKHFPINIKLQMQGERLYFYCRNQKKTGPKQLSTGIGIENIRKRLDLAYGNAYKYLVTDTPEFYTAELTINKL